MGWLGSILGEGVESAANSISEGFGFGDVSQVATTMSDNGLEAKAAGKSSWWEKGIEKAMPSIMGAAMMPKRQQNAPVAPGGHAVQANPAPAMQPFQEVDKLANEDPLQNLHQWSNLFS